MAMFDGDRLRWLQNDKILKKLEEIEKSVAELLMFIQQVPRFTPAPVTSDLIEEDDADSGLNDEEVVKTSPVEIKLDLFSEASVNTKLDSTMTFDIERNLVTTRPWNVGFKACVIRRALGNQGWIVNFNVDDQIGKNQTEWKVAAKKKKEMKKSTFIKDRGKSRVSKKSIDEAVLRHDVGNHRSCGSCEEA